MLLAKLSSGCPMWLEGGGVVGDHPVGPGGGPWSAPKDVLWQISGRRRPVRDEGDHRAWHPAGAPARGAGPTALRYATTMSTRSAVSFPARWSSRPPT